MFLRPQPLRTLARAWSDLRPRRRASSRCSPATSRAPSRRRSRPRSSRRSRAGEHLLAEAGTGTGKSLAYLIPALESGQRVVVSTATKALQEQLLTKDVPIAAAALGREVRVAVLKGRQNYLCRHGLHGLRAARRAALPARRGRRARSTRCAAGSTRPRPATAPSSTSSRRDAVWAEIAVGADRCLGRRCAFVGRLLLRGRARRGRRRPTRDREPRALLRRPRAAQPHRRAGDPARARRRRSSTRRTGSRSRRRPGSAAGSAGRSSTASLRDVDRACREAAVPGAGARARPGRARRRCGCSRAVAPPSGPAAAARGPRPSRPRRSPSALAELADALDGRARRARRRSRRARCGWPPTSTPASRPTTRNRVVWAEPDAARLGAGRRRRARSRELLWDDGPDRRSSSRRR